MTRKANSSGEREPLTGCFKIRRDGFGGTPKRCITKSSRVRVHKPQSAQPPPETCSYGFQKVERDTLNGVGFGKNERHVPLKNRSLFRMLSTGDVGNDCNNT